MVDKYTELAHQIIDLVEEKIVEAYPKLKKLQEKTEGNTFLYGEDYYDLEDEIADKIKLLKEGKENVGKTGSD